MTASTNAAIRSAQEPEMALKRDCIDGPAAAYVQQALF